MPKRSIDDIEAINMPQTKKNKSSTNLPIVKQDPPPRTELMLVHFVADNVFFLLYRVIIIKGQN